MRIFVVEDNQQTQGYLLKTLGDAGHSVTASGNGIAALRRALTEAFDVLIVDRMIPDMDGLSLVKAIRSAGVTTPVLMLTSMATISDRVEGLEAGADDYLIKPYTFRELSARILALARRATSSDDGAKLIVGAVVLDRIRRTVRSGDAIVDLQPREFQLLELLMLNAGRVVTRTMMLEQVWGLRFNPGTNLIETHMSRLRTKVCIGDGPPMIQTVRGQGYMIRAPG